MVKLLYIILGVYTYIAVQFEFQTHDSRLMTEESTDSLCSWFSSRLARLTQYSTHLSKGAARDFLESVSWKDMTVTNVILSPLRQPAIWWYWTRNFACVINVPPHHGLALSPISKMTMSRIARVFFWLGRYKSCLDHNSKKERKQSTLFHCLSLQRKLFHRKCLYRRASFCSACHSWMPSNWKILLTMPSCPRVKAAWNCTA